MSSDNTFERHQSMGLTVLVFNIRNRQVKLPVQMFSESTPFCSFIKKATSDHPDQPLFVGKENEDDFWQFVRYMILRGRIVLDVAAHTSILKFVTKFSFDLTRAVVIRDFPDIGMVDKIVLGRDYCVEEWLVPSLNQYVSLGKSITLQDVERMGSEYVLKIIQIRENFKQFIREDRIYTTEVDIRFRHDFTNSLATLFEEELRSFKDQNPLVTTCNAEDFELVEIYFLVEDCLYKSYRHFFEVSPIFQDMFSLPIQNKTLPDGWSEVQPLRLGGIKKVDFMPFIETINPGSPVETEFSLTEWSSILKLSTMWEFTELRQYAIHKIEKLQVTNAKKIQLARDCHVRKWLLHALNEYARQRGPATAEGVELLSWPYLLKIVQAREEMGFRTVYGRKEEITPWIEARVGGNFKDAIENMFSDEIERIRHRKLMNGCTGILPTRQKEHCRQ